MNSRQRVIDVIRHRRPDRMPIYSWVRANLDKQISERFGSCDAFEDHYEFDLAHLFSGFSAYDSEQLNAYRQKCGGAIDPVQLLDLPLRDPNDSGAYEELRKAIAHHKARDRFLYVQTHGIFEALNRPFRIENHLMYTALYEEELKDVYRRQAEWNRAYAMNCLDLGVDMVHISDDWGAQTGLMFSPDYWRRMIQPYHRIVCDAVKKRGAFLSLHSDGNVMSVLDGIVELGYDVVHPFQESAGMDLDVFRRKYRNSFTVLGGLDVQNTIGFGDYDKLRREIERVVDMFRDGGLLFCTTHFVQDHCTIEELTFAYDLVYKLVRT